MHAFQMAAGPKLEGGSTGDSDHRTAPLGVAEEPFTGSTEKGDVKACRGETGISKNLDNWADWQFSGITALNP